MKCAAYDIWCHGILYSSRILRGSFQLQWNENRKNRKQEKDVKNRGKIAAPVCALEPSWSGSPRQNLHKRVQRRHIIV
jgi:hypothetical protein